MTALAHSPTAALPANAASAQGAAFATEVKDFAAAEALWRDLETAGTGSPYQRFDWQKAYVEAMAAGSAFEARVVQVRDGLGRVLLLLPLGIERRQGLRIGAPIGGKHANYQYAARGAWRGAPLPCRVARSPA
jgi:CelD/BcsL family acetyltransferase involved in cellulose biosynthesis